MNFITKNWSWILQLFYKLASIDLTIGESFISIDLRNKMEISEEPSPIKLLKLIQLTISFSSFSIKFALQGTFLQLPQKNIILPLNEQLLQAQRGRIKMVEDKNPLGRGNLLN